LYAGREIGTVVVPFWPSAYFWPVITRKFRDYVTGFEAFKGRWALRHGRNINSLLGSDAFDGDVLAIRMNISLKGAVSCYTHMYKKKEKRKWRNMADP